MARFEISVPWVQHDPLSLSRWAANRWRDQRPERTGMAGRGGGESVTHFLTVDTLPYEISAGYCDIVPLPRC